MFVGKSSLIKLEYEFLSKKYPDIKFFISTQTVLSYPTGILLQHDWGSRPVGNTFKRLNEAGILIMTKKQELSTKNINRTAAIFMKKSKDYKPTNIATLKVTLPTVFILVGGLICVTIPVFAIECRRSISRGTKSILRVILFRHYRKSKRMAARNIMSIAVAVCDTGKSN